MLAVMVMAMALGQATDGASQQQQEVYDAAFRPLRRSERSYAKNGPAGPYYPQRAHDARTSGSAIIRCRLLEGGELEACKPISQLPTNSNFAIAARIMADRKRIYLDGNLPVGETVFVRVPFVLGAPAAVEP